MSKEIPKSTKVVVIGGGVAGTSCAYHLAKFGGRIKFLKFLFIVRTVICCTIVSGRNFGLVVVSSKVFVELFH